MTDPVPPEEPDARDAIRKSEAKTAPIGIIFCVLVGVIALAWVWLGSSTKSDKSEQEQLDDITCETFSDMSTAAADGTLTPDRLEDYLSEIQGQSASASLAVDQAVADFVTAYRAGTTAEIDSATDALAAIC